MPEMITISEAARRLGISRSRLSIYVKEAALKKTISGNTACVDLAEVSDLVVRLGAEGKLRTPKTAKRSSERSNKQPSEQPSDLVGTVVATMKTLMDRMTEENSELRQSLKAEREASSRQLDAIQDKLDALTAELNTLKMLPAPQRAGATLDVEGLSKNDILAAAVDACREKLGENIVSNKPRRLFWW